MVARCELSFKSYSASSSPLPVSTLANVEKVSSTPLLKIPKRRWRELALHTLAQTIYNILKYFQSSKLVLGHGHMPRSWAFCFSFSTGLLVPVSPIPVPTPLLLSHIFSPFSFMK